MDALDRAFELGLDPIARAEAGGLPSPPGPKPMPPGLEQEENEETRTGRLGRELTGADPLGALQAARMAGRSARDVKIEALRAARSRLSGETPNPAAALFGAAAGLLSPSRTGALSESLGQGFRGAQPGVQELLRARARQGELTDRIGVEEAGVEVADADRAYQELQNRLQLGSQLTGRADTLEERRLTREQRAEDTRLNREQLAAYRAATLAARHTNAGKPRTFFAAGIGIVRDNGDGEVEVVFPAPTKDVTPQLRAQLRKSVMTQPWFKERQWASPEEAADFADRFVDRSISGEADLTTGKILTPQSAPSSGGPKPLKLASDEFDLDDTTPQGDPNKQNLPGAPPPMIDKALQAGERSARQFEGKDLAAFAKEAATEGAAAAAIDDQIDYIRGLKTPTGKLAPLKQFWGQWADALGLGEAFKQSVANANSITAMNALVNDQVLQKQLLQKGVQTEGDAKRLFSTLAQVTNPEEANELILRYQKAVNFSAAQRQRFVEQWQRSAGGYFGPEGKTNVRSAWLDYRLGIPLVGSGKDGKPIFLNEYLDQAKKMNPDEPSWRKQALRSWKSRFSDGIR